MDSIRARIRDVPDFPKKGIVFKDITPVLTDGKLFREVIDAYARFGKGRHPAKLNMGDCYAYACAKANRASLLFTGQDFTKTDIAVAACPL